MSQEVKSKKKCYVMFSCNCEGVGGGKLYLKNKIKFLRQNGWDIEVFPMRQFSNDNVLISELVEFSLYLDYSYELSVPPHYLSKQKRKQVIRSIAESIERDADTYFIESNCVANAYWGEMLAKELSCPHLCFIFAERYNSFLDYYFFEFKLARQELAGINVNSLPLLFKGRRELTEEERYVLKAPCSADVVQYEAPQIQRLTRVDFNIATIGRLEKKYIGIMYLGVIEFAQRYPEKQINLILVGDVANEFAKKQVDFHAKKKINNLNIVEIGFLSPLPTSLFEKTDLFISTSGSANVSARQGVPTISMDVADGDPIGILGYTTMNSQYRGESDEKKDLIEWIELVLIDQICKDKDCLLPQQKSVTDLLEQHFEFMRSASKEKEYYDIDSGHIQGGYLRKLFCRIFGYKAFVKIRKNFF